MDSIEDCDICGLSLNKGWTQELSCNHKFHFNCFKGYIFKTKHTFFVDCPNCRQMNINIEYPFSPK